MPTTPRPLKAAGTAQYQTEVAAGVLDIIDAEVDADIDTLYNLCNGHLDNANLAANAGITYAKLALAGSIKGSDLAPGISFPAGAVVPPNSVSTAALADGAVTLAKLGVGAAVAGIGQQRRTDTLSHNAVNNEQVYLDFTWTSRGGVYVVLAGLHVVFGYDSASPAPGYAVNVRLDGTAGAIDGALAAFQWFQEPTTSAAGIWVSPATVSVGYLSFGATAGVHRIKVCGIPINRLVSYAHINSGWGVVVELA